jgi:hypothetical protein
MSLWLLGVFLACQVAGDGDFRAGLQSTRAGNQAEAVIQFRAALAQGAKAPATYHGLGNALYRQGNRGAAIAAWRRGLLLSPRDGDIAANLARAQRENRDQLDPPAAHRGAFFWQAAVSPRESGLLASGCLAVGIWIIAAHRWRRYRRPRPGRQRGRGWALLMTGVGLLVAISTIDALEQRRGAVVVVDSVAVRSALGPEGVALFVLHEGAEVQLIETGARHSLVALSDGRKGWLATGAVISTDPASAFPTPPAKG